MALQVVNVEKHGSSALHVTVQGDNVTEVTSVAAKRLAYEERGKHGFETGGIEIVGGAYPVDKKALLKGEKNFALETGEQMKAIAKRPKDLAYRHLYRINRGI